MILSNILFTFYFLFVMFSWKLRVRDLQTREIKNAWKLRHKKIRKSLKLWNRKYSRAQQRTYRKTGEQKKLGKLISGTLKTSGN